jgi:hypothetical protein
MRVRLAVLALVVLAGTLAPASSLADEATDIAQVRENAVRWAVSQNGLHEIGTTNCSPAIDRWQGDMGLRVPPCRVWCGAFVHQAFRQGGVQLSHRLIAPDRSYYDAIAGRNGLRRIPVSQIQRGDIVFYFAEPGKKATHLAIVRARPRGGMLSTVEGNTSHAVRLERRSLKYLVLAARVTGDA